MNRRTYLRLAAGGALAGSSGCLERYQVGAGSHAIKVSPITWYHGDYWEVEVQLRNLRGDARTFHEVVLVAFDDTGAGVVDEPVGDIPRGEGYSHSVEVTVETSRFPAVVTITAEETPCDDARIQMAYWIGSEERRREDHGSGGLTWDRTNRRCDEPLPPDRVLDEIGTGIR